ncbi:MAG: YwqG family protein, partial [Haliscomenobacter sp.]|uniref:YwqG family protein n=1 Tax=Haliscomenobacter sp. TaxID=2717303 RepID=UPI0029A81CAC
MPLQLPSILEKFQEKVEATLNHTIRIKPSAQAPIYLWQSKIGGKPYWPKDMAYPKSVQGELLFFLAQFNFAEIPHLEGFPTQGILQFFIAADGMYGLDFDRPQAQNGFRVVYHPEAIEDSAVLESDFAFLPPFDVDTPLPPNASFAL